MGTVAPGPMTYPTLVVVSWAWMASGSLGVRDHAERWQSWQHCGACLPMALHRLALERDEDFEQINGKLVVALVQLDAVQNAVMAASGADIGRPLPVKPFAGLVPAERVYQLYYHHEFGAVDPADALAVVFTGVAGRLEAAIAAGAARDESHAAAALTYGVGASVAGLCTGTTDPSDPTQAGKAAFAETWGRMAGAHLAGQMGASDVPGTLAAVPAFLAALKKLAPQAQ